MSTSRVACVSIPNFAIEIYLRHTAELRDLPLAITESELDDAPIIAINHVAHNNGVLVGMTAAQGHMVCLHLEIRIQDHEREIEQSNSIYKKLQSLSPFVEEAQVGVYYLNAAGLSLLYKNDSHFAQKILDTVAPSGYPLTVGIARSKFVARVAADTTDRFTVVASGDEPRFLKSLPITHLRLPDNVVSRLHDLGLTTIGQIAAFPANEMIRRFGPQGTILSKLARGDDTVFFEPEQPTEELSKVVWLTSPIYRAATILAHVEQLLSPLLAQLGQFSQGCSTIEIALSLEDKTELELPVTVERPTLSVLMFTRQLRTALEQLKLSAPVNGLKVTIPEIAALGSEQLPLDTGLPRLADSNNVIDNRAITTPVRNDTFLPEQRFSYLSLASPIPKNQPEYTIPTYALRTINGLRLIHPPREINVTMNDTHPIAVGKINQPVTSGPWELSGGWWSRRFDRLYWEIRTKHRQVYLIYFDRLTSRWYLQGIFD